MPIAKSRFHWHLLGQVGLQQPQAADYLGVDGSLSQLRIQMQSDQPVDHLVHVQASFPFFPGITPAQNLLHQVGADHLLKHPRPKW